MILLIFISLVSPLSSMSFCDSQPVTSTSTPMHLQWLSQIDPLAVCNDGSPGAYYFSPSTDSAYSNYFVIHLPGGSQCYDSDSCKQRWATLPNYMGSSGLNDTCYKTGILDSSDTITPLSAMNKVMVVYCSSDAYMGDAEASNNTWGWHMRGQRLVFATISHLILNGNLTKNSKIIISGGSAGARGVMVLIDKLVKEHLPKGAKVVGFLDSPFYIDEKPFSPYFKGFQYQEQQKLSFFNVMNVISECSAIYPEKEAWKCLFGQYRIPLVETPFFMVASQYDAYQLLNNVLHYPPYIGSALDYVNNFGNITQKMLKDLDSLGKKENAYFSWTCFNHDVSETLGFIAYKVSSGVNQRDALEEYLDSIGFLPKSFWRQLWLRLRNIGKSRKSWIDQCVGFECGGCDGQNWVS